MQLDNPKAGHSDVKGMVRITGTDGGRAVSFDIDWKDALSLSGSLERNAERVAEEIGAKRGPGESAVAAVG